MTDLLSGATYAANFNLGGVAREADLQAMSHEQLAEYERRQGDPRNFAMSMSLRQIEAMQGVPMPARKPTMTLAEYDAARSAFRPI